MFGIPLSVTNKIGYYSFISILFLIFLYLMQPKPFKKILPSLIFLEKDSKKQNMTSFFKKFIKDPLFFLQLLLLLLLCFAALNITAELMFKWSTVTLLLLPFFQYQRIY